MPEQVAGIAVFICKIESPFVVALPFVFGWNSAQGDVTRCSKEPPANVKRGAHGEVFACLRVAFDGQSNSLLNARRRRCRKRG